MLPITQYLTDVNKTTLANKQNKYIVIHYTGNTTDTARANASYFKTENRGASAHYFVDSTTIYQVVADADVAWSVGKNYGSNNLFDMVKNTNSISIEMCSTGGKISDETFANTVDLTKSLMIKYKISANRVYRHYDVCSKSCPGWTGWLPSNETLWTNFKSQLSTSVLKKSGWVDGKFYLGNTGECVKNAWYQDGTKWYWFDAAGNYVKSTWVFANTYWYYLGEDGKMLTSQTLHYQNKDYYLRSNGAMAYENDMTLVIGKDGAIEVSDKI